MQEKLDNFLRYLKNELERQARLYPSKFSGANGRKLCPVVFSIIVGVCSFYHKEGDWDWTRRWQPNALSYCHW